MRALVWMVSLLIAGSAWAEDLLIKNADVHTQTDRGVLKGYDVLIEGERITTIGKSLTAPSGVSVIDANGRNLTPALFAGITSLGLVEVSSVAATADSAYSGTDGLFHPEFDVSLAYNPNVAVIPVARVEGYGFTLLGANPSANLVGGLGRGVYLDGRYRSFANMPVLFVGIGGFYAEMAGGSRAAQWMVLERMMAEVMAVPRRGDVLLTEAGREAIKEVRAKGKVVFNVHRAADILQVIDFAKRHRLNAVISGAAQAWMVAKELAEAKIPVVLNPLDNMPDSFDMLGARLDNAALLNKAGVTVIFAGQGTQHARKQRQAAGNAVANGLPHDKALAALTSAPAKVFGFDTGRLDVGARADVVLWSGDPLEVNALADVVILNGQRDSLKSRQTRLRDRYLAPKTDLPEAYLKP